MRKRGEVARAEGANYFDSLDFWFNMPDPVKLLLAKSVTLVRVFQLIFITSDNCIELSFPQFNEEWNIVDVSKAFL